MTHLSDVLQQRAATLVESAYEAGYDAAAEVAYEAGYEDGKEQGTREGFEEAVNLIETTRAYFTSPEDDPGDSCDCEDCTDEDEEGPMLLNFSGNYEEDVDALVRAINLISSNGAALDNDLDRLVKKLNDWAPEVDLNIDALFKLLAQNSEAGLALVNYTRALEDRIELLEADAVVAEAVNERLTSLEDYAQGFGYQLPALTVEV